MEIGNQLNGKKETENRRAEEKSTELEIYKQKKSYIYKNVLLDIKKP